MLDGRLSEIVELTRARFLIFLREPEAVFWVFLFPIVLSIVLGFAFRESEPQPSRIGVSKGKGGDEISAMLDRRDGLEVRRPESLEEARRDLRRGRLDALVTVPGLNSEAEPKIRFDPQRNEAMLARMRIEAALGALKDDGAGRAKSEVQIAALEPTSERGSRYIDFLFAGILGMNIMGTAIWGIGFGVADMRQKKLIKRLLVTPMRRSSFLLSFVLQRFVFLLLEVTVLMVFGIWVLDIPLAGHIAAFVSLCILGGLCFAGIGLLVASRARTIEGASGIMNFVMMPMWLASGVFFSYERFPDFLHPYLRLLPLTALNDALRNLMLDGETLFQQGPQIAVLTVWFVLCAALALKIFRWE
ncbi:MAG: ABC transporter permease [Planctomycetota bacterium]